MNALRGGIADNQNKQSAGKNGSAKINGDAIIV